MNEEAIKHAFDLFASDGYTGNYDQFKQLIQSNPEAKTHAFGLFASDGYTGSEVDFDQLIGGGASEPVKKKEESVPLWLQKQEQQQPKPKQEQTPPFLESKPSGISLGSQRVPETAPMFEAPPMRTAEEARAIVESPEDQSKIADSEQGWLLNTVSSLDRGFYKNLIGNPVKGMGTLLEGATAKVFGGTGKGPISDALINFGNYYNNAIDELTPQDEEFKNTLTDQFGQAFGQVASLILTGGVAGAGKEGAALATTAPTGIVGTASAAGKQLASTLTSPTAISGGLSMGQAEFDRAKEAGATDEQAYEVFFKNAAVGSVLEQIPVMQFLKRFNQSTAGGVANYIKTKGVAGLTGGFEEMTTEVLQQLYSNKTAQEIYNINQQLLEGVGESGGVGFGVGFILNAMGAKVKKLKKEGNTAEAQLIENQIENFESKPKGPTPSYSVNGIKIESPEVINQMIDNMDATDLANSNIEITNDPELSVKMQDKMVTSSIKEEVRSANPDIDEDTLDQITALEKERKKFEGKKTQSAKDKLASINSQIKILQENAVQKPSTEEGVLRPEESQVGLQEVGEGDAKAPTEEVAKEEVATTEDFPEVEAVETVDVSSGFEDYNPDSLTIGEDVHYSFNGKSYSKGKVVGRPSASKPNVYTVRNENGVPTVIIYGGERTNVTLKKPTLEQPKEIVATPEEDLQAALDRIEIPEDTEAVPPIVTPRNKAERKEAARRGDMVYHNFDGSIIESTREQYDNALKEIAETGAIENVFNYGKEVSSRQAPNELEIQYEPSLLYMKKEDADSDLKRRTKVEGITDKAVEALPATQAVEAIDSSTRSDVEVEKRMSEIEGDNKYTDEFNSLEKEMEKRERATIFNVPLEKVNDAVDVLIQKEKDKPNGFGTFVEKGDAIETKKVADRYLNAKKLTDAELMKDFSDAVRGNPTTSYADGLKMREALNEATNRGIDTEVMLADVTKVYTDAGYGIETAKSVVAGMLKPVFKGSKKVSSKTPRAKSVPIPVAIPKPAPAPAPAEKAKTKSESFFDVTDKEFPNDHILGGYAVTDEDGGLIGRVSIEEFDDNTVKINEVVSEKRGQRTGNGRKIMEKITKLADENGISLTLVPNIIGEMKAKGFETPQKLKDFYKKFGFVVEPNTGRMTRKPIAKVKAPAPAPAPAPKPIAVVPQPTQRVQGPEALQEEYKAKILEVTLNKDKSRTAKQIEERKKELVEEYKKLKAEMTAPRPKAEPEAKAAPKVEAKPAPKQVETKAEPTSVVEEEEPSYDDIKDLDPTDETALEKVLRKLDSGDASLKQFGRGNLSSGMAIPLARAIIKALKVLVKTGITLQEAIKRVAAENNIEAKDIVSMIKELDKSQSPIVKLKDQIKSEARAALNAKKDINQKRKDLSNTIKEMETTGKISAAKAKAMLNKIGKVNLDNPAAVDTFLDYVENVFENAEYEVEIAGINAKLGKARNNVNRKIGTAKNLTPLLNRLFNIKPSLIPIEVFDEYKNLVDMFGDNAAVLELDEDIADTTKQVQSILEKIDDQLSSVPALATKLFNYDKAILDEDGALDYSATIEKMKADEVIDEAEYKLMKKYKSLILPRAVKIPKTKQELADEKKVLVKQVKEAASETTISELASDDEKKMASNIIKLAKTNAVEALDNRQLENLLKIFDNFKNGYFPAYANGLSNDLIAGENATFLSKAIAKAKMPSLASVKLRLRNKRKALFAKVKSSPLFNIDEIFGDFKTKDIFNSIFNALAQNQQRYTLEIEKINQRLEDALNKIAKTYNNDENKIVESKMKMAIYRIQREFQSNPGDSRVNPAMEYINKTIEAIREGDTNYSEEDADMLEKIAKEYSDGKKPSGIDATKLKESFNSAELEALDVFDKVNQELEGKATFTGDVIRGDKVYLLNDYNHVSVLPKKNENPDTIADAMSKFDPKNVVSTKAKSLIERTSGAKPINFDIFSTVQRGANFVLMDYYLTNPVRIARKSINAASKMMEENGTLNEDTKTIVNVLKDSVELALKASLDQAAVKDTFADKVIKEMAKTGYRAMLGGIPRATTEFTSNMAYIAMVAPTEWSTGVKMMKVIRGGKAVDIMEAVGSKVISRVYGSDPLKGRLVDPSVLSKRVGIGASKLKGETLNVVSTIHNNTTKKVKNFVEFIADGLISTPDKIMMRPLWFGAFDKAFEDFSGKKPDYDKIASNDADYMIKNKEALDASGRVADEKVTMAGNVDNPYMNALRTNVSSDMSGLVKTFKVFDNFMLKFQIGEYLTARRGLYAMMGNGNISKEQGARLMAAVVTRMTVYTVMSKMAAEFMYGLFLDDEEEDDDKSFAQKMGQGLASTFTSLLLGRDFGNAARSVVNYGIEKTNENYLEFLRDGEYDPYEDAIQYTFIPPEKKGKSLEAFDVIANISGPYSPALKSLNFVTKKLTEEPKKEAAAIERQDSEKALRIPLEILGNLGYVPLYKDVRAIVNKSIYSELDKELDEQGKKGEEFKPMGMNKTDLERYYPEIYEQYYGAGSEAEATRKLEYEKNLLERKMKDDYYNYVPKKRPKKGSINRQGINRGGINRGSRGSK